MLLKHLNIFNGEKKMITIAIANRKGGTAKTSTAVNLGAGLAELGKKVLLVDLDPQGNLSTYLGINKDDLDKTIYNALLEEGVNLADIVHQKYPTLDIAPSNNDLSAAEVLLVNEIGRENVLSKILNHINKQYDYIIIDCPPNLGLLTVNALAAAHKVIIPIECAFLATQGLKQLLHSITTIQERLNPTLDIMGILLTKFDSRTSHAQEVANEVRKAFPNKVFNTVISRTVRFDEAPMTGKPILEYASDSPGAIAYRLLTKEVINYE